jgi:type VI secretion system protein ImpC
MTDATDWTADFAGIGQPAPRWAARRPLRIAILGDFSSGALAGRLQTGTALARRKPLKVEFDTLDDAIGRLGLKLQLPLGAGGLPVEVDVSELESFHPDTLYQNLEIFSALSSLRKRLNTPSTFAKAAAEVQAWGGDAGPRASVVERHARARGAAPSSGSTLDDFARLTGRPSVAAAADGSLDDLLRSLVGPFIVPAPSPNQGALVASVDKALSDTMRAVLHQPDFQNAESLWRGVDFLLRRLETSHQLQVHLFDVSAEELAADLSSVADLADSGLYKLLVEQPSQDADGGYGYLCGAYTFDATPPHAELLGRAARVAAHAGAPFITAIQTDPFADRREPPHRLVRAAFTALKEMSDASYLGLIGPRFLLRHPYGKRSDPISSFAMEEFTREDGLRGMLWGHPSLLAMCVLAVRGGQLTIDDLPFHHVVDADGDSVALPCTERLINTHVATLLRDFGINAVMAHKGEAMVRLSGLQAVNGDGLAAPGGAPRKAPGDSRFALRSKAGADDAKVDWAPARRGAGSVAVTSAPMALAQPEPAEAALQMDEPVSEAAADPADDATATAADDDAGAAAPVAEAPAAEQPAAAEPASEMSELDALLASLDDEPAPAEAGAAPPEDALDPELEALLKSLG